jgi:Tfp pilus assembly protein PilO
METNEQQMSIEDLIEKTFDFKDYEDDEKKSLIEEMSAQLMEVALLRSINEGGEPMQESFNTFITTEPSDVEMSQFISDNIPNFGAVIIEEIKNLQNLKEKNTTK